jgi:serine/threonine protein kinase
MHDLVRNTHGGVNGIVTMSSPTQSARKSSEIGDVVCDVLTRRRDGTRVDISAVEAAHTHLMPELGKRLRDLERLETARRQAHQHRKASSELEDITQPVASEFPDDLLKDYMLLEPLDSGGQGVIHKAVQRSTGRIVALKVLIQGRFATERQRRRFARESDLIARLRHPNIVTLYDCGEVRGFPYFAMEFIDGESVDDYALVNCPTARSTMELFRLICSAVHAAHQHGVIHRDLKPSNVLVDADGQPRILDFGLAKDFLPTDDSRDASWESMAGQIVGTLPYLSPEQVHAIDDEVDIRTDIYSLGVMLYELLTEQLPYFVSRENESLQRQILYSQPTEMRRALTESAFDTRVSPSEIDADLEAIVLKALDKEPGERYQSAAALVDDIDRWLKGELVEARSNRRFYLLRKTFRRYRTQAIVAAAFVVVLVSALFFRHLFLAASKT